MDLNSASMRYSRIMTNVWLSCGPISRIMLTIYNQSIKTMIAPSEPYSTE